LIEFCLSRNSMKIRNIFFCHGGIHGIFLYLGAIKELYKQRDQLDLKRLRVYGSSSGGPMGLICLLVLNDILKVDHLISEINKFFQRESARSPLKFTQTCIEMLELLSLQISDPSVVLSLANKHLYIGVSQQQSGFKYINRFTSVSDIFHCLLLSSNLVLIATYPAFYKGVSSIDGGYLMTRDDLPRKCVCIYNQGSTFPACIGIPDDAKQDELINKGILFVNRLISDKNKYKVDDDMFNHYSDTFIQLAFFLQTYLAIKDGAWRERIDSLRFRKIY